MKRSFKDILFVVAQLCLFLLYLSLGSWYGFEFAGWIRYAGLLLAAAGLITISASLYVLDRNLSIFPSPKESSQLIQWGIYRFIRHPIYTGILMITLGYGLYAANPLRLLISLLLLILFWFKASYEEELLKMKFPEYENYRNRSGKFLPKLLR